MEKDIDIANNKQGINDNTTNSNNSDTGDHKNNRITTKNVNKSENTTVTGDHNNITIDKSKKKSLFKKIIEHIEREDLPQVIFLIVMFGSILLSMLFSFVIPKMPWWGILILLLVPFTYWFIIRLLELIKDWISK